MREQSRDDRVCPAPVLQTGHSPLIEVAGYRFEAHSVNGVFPKYLPYFFDLDSRPRNEDDAIRSYTLQLAICQDLLWCTLLRNQQTPEPVPRNATLFETKCSQPL